MLNIATQASQEKWNQGAPLMKVAVVSAFRGTDAQGIYGQVAEGRLRWVFNFAVNPGGMIPDYRFWHPEITGGKLRCVTLDLVIDDILGRQGCFKTCELGLRLSVSRATLARLRDELGGQLLRPSTLFERAGITDFLKQRWCGGGKAGAAALN
jgi:hypothetical protein